VTPTLAPATALAVLLGLVGVCSAIAYLRVRQVEVVG
jgi:hypothetical protein